MPGTFSAVESFTGWNASELFRGNVGAGFVLGFGLSSLSVPGLTATRAHVACQIIGTRNSNPEQ